MTTNSPIPEDLLNLFHPDKDSLLRWLSERVDDQMLSLIANYNHNQDYADNFAALKQIRKTLLVPSPLEVAFEDVLLSRLCESPDYFMNDRPGYPGHVVQAFICAIFSISAADDINGFSIATTMGLTNLLQVIESVQVLEIIPLALQLLSWRILDTYIEESHRPFFALSILFLAILSKTVDGKTLNGLAEWVMQEEATLREELGMVYYGAFVPLTERWLFDLVNSKSSKQANEEKWRKIARQLLLNPPTPHPAEAALSLRLIGSALTGEEA